MSYMESYESLDWPSASGQSSTGLNVQLPGSEHLLPVQNGYLEDTTANLPKETKRHSTVDEYWEIPEEDDWMCFGSIGLPASGDVDESYMVLDDFLPESPEITSFDLNSFSQSQSLNHEDHNRKFLDGNTLKSANLIDEVVLDSDLDFNVKLGGHEAEAVPEDIFDAGRLCDFDPSWLLLPVPILPSLEEVESVLSASPLSVISDDEAFLPTAFDTHLSDELPCASLPVPLQYSGTPLENILLSGSPLDLFLANIGDDGSRATACSSVQASPNITWVGDDESGHALELCDGFFGFDSASAVGTNSDSLLSSESGDASLLSDVEEIGSTASPCAIRSSPVSVSARAEPYPTSGVKPERRERKREQNKTAALKYRQKKRVEQGVYVSECEQLEKRNSDLKSRVEELTREISYLKGLISEIYSSQAE